MPSIGGVRIKNGRTRLSGLKIHKVIVQGRWIWGEHPWDWNSIQSEAAWRGPLTISKVFACHNLIESVQTAAERDTRCHGTFPPSRNTGREKPGDESVSSVAFHSRALRDITKDI